MRSSIHLLKVQSFNTMQLIGRKGMEHESNALAQCFPLLRDSGKLLGNSVADIGYVGISALFTGASGGRGEGMCCILWSNCTTS
mmetsp:Transcript_37111/g.6612  ORF Transcript_37111/g.6612 Transcript_37111/m.6612 type:complete len:84 (-) Transcript_37111:92-343(-)